MVVVDALEAIQIQIEQGRGGPVSLHIVERPGQRALEAAPVEDVQERIDLRHQFELGNLRPGLGKGDRQAADLARRHPGLGRL